MPEMTALEHLKIAKRLHFQGMTNDAIREYEAVLEMDPDNGDAIAGLRSLGIEPVVRDDSEYGAVGHAGGLKTNFFANQSKQDKGSDVRGKVFNVIILAMGIASAYGLYILATYLLNYDNITARENVEVHFEKPQMKDNIAIVNVEVINLNPAPIKHMKISYRIADPTDQTLKEDVVEIAHGQVPAGDRRTFAEVKLGEVKGVPAKLSPKLESLVYGPKPKIKEKYVDEFMKAAALRDKDALGEYEQLVDNTEDFAPSHVGLGRAYAARGKFDEALKQYAKATEIDPMNANAHYYMAVALFYLGERDKARAEIDKAFQVAPDDPEIEWNKKYMYQMKGNLPGAKKNPDEGKGKDGKDAKGGEAKEGDAPAADAKKK